MLSQVRISGLFTYCAIYTLRAAYAKSLSMKLTFRIDSWTVSRKMPAYQCPNATMAGAKRKDT